MAYTFQENVIPLIPKKGFTFGCDPEGFIFDKGTGEVIPANYLIPGTKQKPHKVNKGAVQVDGMAAEFNIDPASTYEEWEDNITTVIKQLEDFLPSNMEIRWVPVAEFSPAEFDKAPDSAKELGCQPDFDAWSGDVNPPPLPKNPYMRCAGGHLHTGWTTDESLSDPQHLMNCRDLVMQYDWFLGGWATQHDKDVKRRELYGKMGACRYKDYGVEYRVLSNFWVNSAEHRRAVWDRMVSAINHVAQYFIPDRVSSGSTALLRGAINNRINVTGLGQAIIFPIMTLDQSYRNL